MRPLEALDATEARGLTGVLFDLDDTLLDAGRLTEPAYSALFRLAEAGLRLIAVTGRPAGWGALLVRQWPIDGAVTENGAIALYRNGGAVVRLDRVAEDERRARRRRIAALVAEIRERFPMLTAADDVDARLSDFTFDIGEHVRVPEGLVRAATAFIDEQRFTSTRSSVHLHVSLDADDKASGTLRLLGHLFDADPTAALRRWAFIGDSQNDEACFNAFRTTIAVSNFTGRFTVAPRYVTRAARGAGFAELAGALTRLRSG